jgi:arylsulfatase A-like enzyme
MPAATGQEVRPNILIIVTDDQRRSLATMPETRRIFEASGTRYRNGVTPTPFCCPARASIFSGQYAHNHGVRNNHLGDALNTDHTIQAQLQRVGYLTAISGKYLNHLREAPRFNRYSIILGSGRTRYFDTPFNVEGEIQVADYSTTFIGTQATSYLRDFEASDETPWMMQVSPFAPHAPALPEPRYRDAPIPDFKLNRAHKETEFRDKPTFIKAEQDTTLREIRRLRAKQLRSLMTVDDIISDIFALLDELEESNTLAFFVSDNGYFWFEHRLENKDLAYDPAVRIPFYARWPGHLSEGVSRRRIASLIDIAPTIYQAAGVVPDYAVDGKSLLIPNGRSYAFVEYFRDPQVDIPDWRSYWTPREVFIQAPGYPGVNNEWYAPKDRWQLHNRLEDGNRANNPENLRAIKAAVRADAQCVGTSCP